MVRESPTAAPSIRRVLPASPQEDRECAIQGQYVEFDPPLRLAFTWAGPATDHAESLVTVELRAIAGGTELTLLHERLPNAQSRDNHAAGWAVIFDRLNEAVAR